MHDSSAVAVASATVETSETEVPMTALASVPQPLRSAIEARGFADLTVVQSAVLSNEAADRDLQISSQTGSGKTVALGLVLAPLLLQAAAQRGKRKPVALVIAPTRELAVQVRGELAWLFAGVETLEVECVTGGSSVMQEKRRLSSRPLVVVGTPGRMLDHVRSGALDCSEVAQLVLDEADRMLDMGFREELEAILDATPATRRTHLVSATFPAEIQRLARKYQTDPLPIQGTRLGAANEDIEHTGHLVRLHDRYAAIVNTLLLTGDERTLIFVNTRAQAGELAAQLSADGFAAAPISGELEQNQRTRTLDAFRSGVTTTLVATDVAARGLDIPDVAVVIHTDAPFDAESYTHRAGRTGRAGRKGRSVLLSTPMRQKKIEMLLSRAKVKLQWREVPTVAAVEKALAKRERRQIREFLEAAAEPSESQIEFAQKLLEGSDAAQVVARLIEKGRDPRHAAALEINPIAPGVTKLHSAPRGEWKDRPEPRGQRRVADARESYSRDSRPARENRPMRDDRPTREDRPVRDAASALRMTGDDRPMRDDRPVRDERRPAGRRRNEPEADRFELNWGHRAGATPQRVLAVICRRGEVSNREIGSIDIDANHTSFEVVREASSHFQHYAEQPDERDPRLVIRRARR
jgi:ATP-dependent RNA helicase DeaD